MTTHTVKINRAPVLTLWATVVAERLGYDQETALTLGKAVAGLNAQSKGRRLGLFEEPKDAQKDKELQAGQSGEASPVSLLHRRVPIVKTDQGVRATVKGQAIDPASVKRYLTQKFRHDLADVQAAMEVLAKSYSPDQLAAQAYALYEQFRPDLPDGETRLGSSRTIGPRPYLFAGRRKIAFAKLASLSIATTHRLLRTLHPDAAARNDLRLEAVG